MFFKKKKQRENFTTTEVKKIIDYSILKIDYENFYSFSKIFNNVDNISRRLLYDTKEKKVLVGELYDKNIISFNKIKN